MNYYLGIDTSCYTTSVAMIDKNGSLIADKRKILNVKAGGRGLSQSEMVFQHTRNLPELFESALSSIQKPSRLLGIGVSACPRPIPDSYMPAFLVGDGYARALSSLSGAPLYRISHQEGHIFAGMWSAQGPNVPAFLAVHASGGTTEIVKVVQEIPRISVSILGESLDLHAGQFIDRVGVAMGLAFPAGRILEELSKEGQESPSYIPCCVKSASVSFSGPTSHALRLLEKGEKKEHLAAGVQLCIGQTLAKMIKNSVQITELRHVLLVGGVLSNEFIRNYLIEKLNSEGLQLHFPEKNFSPDNGTGPAYFALRSST